MDNNIITIKVDESVLKVYTMLALLNEMLELIPDWNMLEKQKFEIEINKIANSIIKGSD